MDTRIQYPSVDGPSKAGSVNVSGSCLQYPDPVSIESITQELSEKAEVSPAQASETLLVSIPGAVAHLVDREASPHLATGPFSIIRLNQNGNALAIFARVGNELQWPLTRDEAAVKLDDLHYFFGVTVPPEVEKECSALSPDVASIPDDNILNYGITFSVDSDVESLRQLDEVLKQYCYFKAPQVTTDAHEEDHRKHAVADGEVNISEINATARLKGVPAEDYWTALAPNVEDYSGSLARAIASGAGHIIKGIFFCSDATISQLEKGNKFLQGKVKPKDGPTKISPAAMRRIKRVQKISAMCEQIVGGVLSGVLKAAAFITRPLVTSKAGQKLLSLLPGQVALASLDGFGKIFDALEIAGKNVLTTTSSATTGLVSQRYGNEAGEFTQHSLNAVGGFITTAWTVSKIRKVFYPRSLVKSTAKMAGNELRLKEQCQAGDPVVADEKEQMKSK